MGFLSGIAYSERKHSLKNNVMSRLAHDIVASENNSQRRRMMSVEEVNQMTIDSVDKKIEECKQVKTSYEYKETLNLIDPKSGRIIRKCPDQKITEEDTDKYSKACETLPLLVERRKVFTSYQLDLSKMDLTIETQIAATDTEIKTFELALLKVLKHEVSQRLPWNNWSKLLRTSSTEEQLVQIRPRIKELEEGLLAFGWRKEFGWIKELHGISRIPDVQKIQIEWGIRHKILNMDDHYYFLANLVKLKAEQQRCLRQKKVDLSESVKNINECVAKLIARSEADGAKIDKETMAKVETAMKHCSVLFYERKALSEHAKIHKIWRKLTAIFQLKETSFAV